MGDTIGTDGEYEPRDVQKKDGETISRIIPTLNKKTTPINPLLSPKGRFIASQHNRLGVEHEALKSEIGSIRQRYDETMFLLNEREEEIKTFSGLGWWRKIDFVFRSIEEMRKINKDL